MINCSMVSAYSPKIFIEVTDDEMIYNSAITQKISEGLIEKLSAENKFIVTEKNSAEYILEGKIIGIGEGRLVNNPMGTAYTISSSVSSLFLSPFAGPILGGVGMIQIRKKMFAISFQVNITRCSENKMIRSMSVLGRYNLRKKNMSQEVVEETILNTIDLMSERLINDLQRDEPKIFVEPPRKIKLLG